MKLYIRNMVSIRCKMAVKRELTRLGLHYLVVDLGEVEITGEMSTLQHDQLQTALERSGLELLKDKKSVLIQRIKSVIVELVHHSSEPMILKLSEILSKKLNYDYTYLANTFSEVLGTTIEKFTISHKIERVKELLFNRQLNLTEIADLMHYSSVSHLSRQFKKVTGLTPSYFKQYKTNGRLMLEEL